MKDKNFEQWRDKFFRETYPSSELIRQQSSATISPFVYEEAERMYKIVTTTTKTTHDRYMPIIEELVEALEGKLLVIQKYDAAMEILRSIFTHNDWQIETFNESILFSYMEMLGHAPKYKKSFRHIGKDFNQYCEEVVFEKPKCKALASVKKKLGHE